MKRRCLARLRASASIRVTRVTPIAAVCAALGGPVLAAEPAADPARHLSEVVVTATRTEERADAVASTITAIDASRIERAQPVDETALFADEPDIDVPRDRRRFGAGSINIRGIEDNRVLLMVDGVRLPDYYNGGGPSNLSSATRDAPEFSFLKRVEVLRGPASSLYGSDAIGGVVSYVTKDPEDIMRGRAVGGEAGLSWNGIDRSFGQTAGVAGGNETIKGLFMYAHRKGHEVQSMGGNDTTSTGRTKANPQNSETNAWLGKIVLDPAAGHRLKLTYEHRDNDTFTDIRRLSTALPRVTSANGTEDLSRNRVSLDYEWKPASRVIDRLSASVFYQESESNTVTNQVRSRTSSGCSGSTAGTSLCDVNLLFGFRQQQTGFNLQADKSFNTGVVGHRLITGVDFLRTQTSEMRDGTTYNRTTGVVSKSLAGDNFPIHDFPKGETRQTGIFVQDELQFAGGRFTLTPGLRFDHYSLGPDDDKLYNSVASKPAISKSDSALSPKLSALWQATDRINLWAQYVFGYRAPNYQEINGSFRNTIQGYGAAPNGDLNPEKSRSFEIGARYTDERVQTSVAVFDNRYKDFIEQVALRCPSDPACLAGLRATYQYRNQSSVRIYGAEWRGSYRFLPQWRVDSAVAYAHGNNEQTGQPLNSVSPLRASAALTWERGSSSQGQGASLRWRGARAVTRTDDTSFAYFKPGGYGVADIQGWWRFNRYASLVLSVNNVFDKKYWLWGDVRQGSVAASEPGLDFYTQPGRTFAASVKLSF
ncbi:TonB-dependent hemoglobin/transferrin/lactoferrin family receptor [Cupriavidus basilensis]|uniref:TonB-dependent hemoglobin/transferrin/lactoferrin family receptor n=1 Tax=Cupriavidus basilensis TaxID=68895 RepID=A0A643FXJ2_9BURK|nr:TonB-dependent hemoglobin/transferrin/lactoferrin family receptor [Cupriavidus basilensis]QOT76491.1 TonB-dependent hemoglobin/transferrin/lactoferrin family receptor [Cupriavidus basilensis]